MTLELDGQVAIVTGAGGGLGAAIAARLSAEGARVAWADIDPAAASARADGAFVVEVDVTDPGSAQRMAAAVLKRFDRIDILVNNAGIAGPTAPLVELEPADWERVIRVNLSGAFHCTRACLPPMLAAGRGRIVNVSSIAGVEGNPFMAAYSASKAGMIAMTKSVAKEIPRSGVLVNCVVPAALDGGLTAAVDSDQHDLFRSRIPMGRLGRPDELAELVAWLASSRCSFSTGATSDQRT
jgi:2-dehydro-3-deoxy-L-rhamnonate dehydrogenase (NAD+)